MTTNNQIATQLIEEIATDGGIPGLFRDAGTWFSYHSWEILIAIAIAVGIVALLLGFRQIGVRLCKKTDPSGWRAIIGRAIAKTGTFFMIMVAARLVAGYARAPSLLENTISFLFTVSAAFQAAIWTREFVLGVVERRANADDYHGEALGNALGIIRLLITVALFAIASIVVLDNLGVNVTGLVAGLGIGGIAIGMAAKGIFDDLFAALSILFDKPFRRGDAIKWDQTSGTVEMIGLKTTRIRAITGEEVVVSNANLLNKELHNMARQHRRRHVLTFGLVYQTPPETCARVPDIVREVVESHKKCRLIRCGMTGFGQSSLDYETQFDVLSDDFEEVFAARSTACIELLERFNKEGIAFAYPTTTNFTAAPDGTMVMPYNEHPAAKVEARESAESDRMRESRGG